MPNNLMHGTGNENSFPETNSNQKAPESKPFFYVPAVSGAIGVNLSGMETLLLKPPYYSKWETPFLKRWNALMFVGL